MGCGCSNNASLLNNENISRLKRENSNILISKKKLIGNSIDILEEKYEILKKLYDGEHSNIFLVNYKPTDQKRLLKILEKKFVQNINSNDNNNSKICEEIEILSNLDHPNIVKIFDYFSDHDNYYLVLEYITGNNLIEIIENDEENHNLKNYYQKIMKQIFSVMMFLHSQNIIFRNLKADNIIILNDTYDLKLVGFTSAFHVSDKLDENNTFPYVYFSSTVHYLAPEYFKKEYSYESDLWSCGVILYFLVFREPPFYNSNIEIVKKYIKICKLSRNLNELDKTPEGKATKDLLNQLLVIDPSQRIKEKNIFSTDFFKLNKNVDSNFQNASLSLYNFSKEKLKIATQSFIVHQIEQNENISKLRAAFDKMDKSGEGLVSKEELGKMSQEVFGTSLSAVELDNLFNQIDIDKSGTISFEEFLRVTLDKNTITTKKNLKNAFNYFDKDGSGKLSEKELYNIFTNNNNDNKNDDKNNEILEYVRNTIKKFDVNKDGEIDFDEFVMMMTSNL
jgi:calcium-dependent protein kinase